MATNISNHTYNSSYETLMLHHSASECIPWLVILITECLAIVILNIITIIVFVKKRQLQRRSTYLIIHLAIVDLLAGAVSGPLQIEQSIAKFCNVWKFDWNLTWSYHVKLALLHLFSFTSQANLVVISIERLHATFCPLSHHFINKWVYRVIIILIWLTSTTREVAQVTIREISGSYNTQLIGNILYIPFYSISLFVICASYSLIVIKVRCSRHPQFHGATKRERKLTGTSVLVALVSLLCFLPALTYAILFCFVVPLETSYLYDCANNILGQLAYKSCNLRSADATIQSRCITNILQGSKA